MVGVVSSFSSSIVLQSETELLRLCADPGARRYRGAEESMSEISPTEEKDVTLLECKADDKLETVSVL